MFAEISSVVLSGPSILNPAARLSLLLMLPVSMSTSAYAQGPIFEQPFVVEHHMVQVDESGDRYASPPVVDTYGGSWIVSQRADGSRLVVDLARREMTEIRSDSGTYSTLGFERLAEVMRRLAELEGTRSPASGADRPTKSRTAADWTIKEGSVKAEHLRHIRGKAAGLMHRDGIRHLTVEARDGAKSTLGKVEPAAELWLDPSVKIGPAARSALADFERSALGTEGVMEAAREFTDGAIPIRTVRGETKADGSRRLIEDVVIRLETLESFDRGLIAIPEGLRKVPHPLEGLMAYLEKESQRERMMSGAGGARSYTDSSSGGND